MSVSSSVLSVVVVLDKNAFLDVANDIVRCLRHGWYSKDELGMVGVGDSWIESNQLWYIDGSVAVIVQ